MIGSSGQSLAEPPIHDRATQVLRSAYGPTASFRPGQLEAVTALVEKRARLLLVQRTGWGKSVVYFVATRLMRHEGAGPTLIVSPLLALMRDQVIAAKRFGLAAVTINSSNQDTWASIESEIKRGAVDLILVSPERLHNDQFRSNVFGTVIQSNALLVIDEAHCISDWGHDFRPDYRRLTTIVDLMPRGVPIVATTATANNRVVADVSHQLGSDVTVIRGSLSRPNLELHAMSIPGKAHRLAWLAGMVAGLPGTGIVYCLTILDAEMAAKWLRSRGVQAVAYSGGADDIARERIERRLRTNDVKVVCATSALGMGFDKPDLGFVIHFQSPSSPVAYYQQVGRAGRATEEAVAVLLAGREDQGIWESLLDSSLPQRAAAEQLVHLLERRNGWRSLTWIQQEVNLTKTAIEKLLKNLEVEGAVERRGAKYRRAETDWTFDAERVDRVWQQRIAEQVAMTRYTEARHCRMAYLQEQLDDPSAGSCRRCDNCAGARFATDVPASLLADAESFLKKRSLVIAPRKTWPGGRVTGPIPPGHQLAAGRSLSMLGDGAWGDVVLACKRGGRPFPHDIVEALAELLEHWRPVPKPAWITYVPTIDETRRFVPDLAYRLGARVGIPVLDVVSKVRRTERQKLMQNHYQQLSNVWSAYAVGLGVPPAPLLLLDDIADSRWTLTYIGYLLRRAGSGPVLPLTLAQTKG